ncbi:MAG: phospholipase D-like domain-containing protein [Pseudomonadota bacterium]
MSVAEVQPLLTAAEAYPELEKLFLRAETSVRASFRIFDLTTPLYAPEAREVGVDWFDLLVATLRRGVTVTFTLADFDPLLATDLHAQSWRSARQFWAAADCAPPGRLRFRVALHGARPSPMVTRLMQPFMRRKLAAHAARVRALSDRQASAWLLERPGVRAHLGSRGGRQLLDLHPATHHQKLAVFDERVLFIGGLDVNPRRYDDPAHTRAAAQTWQDVSVIASGRVVADAVAHLKSLEGAETPPPSRHFLITKSAQERGRGLRLSPRTVDAGLERATLEQIRKARHLVYIETQFFRSRRIAEALAAQARANRDLGLILILPAAPEDAAFHGSTGLETRYGEYLQARAVRRVRRAFGARAFVGMPVRPRRRHSDGRDTAEGAPAIYIHSKVSVADDDVAVVSSANMNGRSLRWDTEAGLRLDDPAQVATLRRRLFDHWLPIGAEEALYRSTTAVAAWSALAQTNRTSPPEARRGFIVPYDVRPAEELGMAVPLVPEETV